MPGSAESALLVIASAAIGAGGALVMTRGHGLTRLLGALPGLLALAALLLLESTDRITGHQLTLACLSLVLASAAVTLVVPRRARG